jgi:hypothetical protein
VVSCEEAVEKFVETHPEVDGTPEAAAAMAAARAIDDPGNSATSKSMMVGRFLDALELMRAMAPEKPEESELDRIRTRLADAEDRLAPARRRRASAG